MEEEPSLEGASQVTLSPPPSVHKLNSLSSEDKPLETSRLTGEMDVSQIPLPSLSRPPLPPSENGATVESDSIPPATLTALESTPTDSGSIGTESTTPALSIEEENEVAHDSVPEESPLDSALEGNTLTPHAFEEVAVSNPVPEVDESNTVPEVADLNSVTVVTASSNSIAEVHDSNSLSVAKENNSDPPSASGVNDESPVTSVEEHVIPKDPPSSDDTLQLSSNSEALSAGEPKVLFEVPLMSSIVYTTEEGSKLELSQLEKESLDAAFEIQGEEALVSTLVEAAGDGPLIEKPPQEEGALEGEEEEVINETSSEDNDDDVDDPQGSLTSLRAQKEGSEEFNTLWKTLNEEESPEMAIMEEVEDEFLKDLESDLEGEEKLQSEEKASQDSSSKDDKSEDISKIAAFINETASPPKEKEWVEEANKPKKRVKVKLTNHKAGKIPRRVGRPPKHGGGKQPKRVGRPPGRPGKPKKKRGRPPTKKLNKVPRRTPSLENGSRASHDSPAKAEPTPKIPSRDKVSVPQNNLRTYESDWRAIMRMKGNDYDKFVDQIFYASHFPGTHPYNPGSSANISQLCAQSLSSWDLEKLQCPACPDSFLIPTSFFQHLYRQSCEILFKCKPCDDVLTFPNRCALKVHFLSHMELDKSLSSVDIDHAILRPPSGKQKTCSESHILEPISRELFNKDKRQCPECHLCLDSLVPHMNDKHKIIHCKSCSLLLPNSCSYASHARIHEGLGPFVCPECGEEFQTQEVYREHVLDFCLHQHRTLVFTCPFRHKDKSTKSQLEYADLLKHVMAHHLRHLYKCSYCSRAFTSEGAICLHVKEEHSSIPEYLREKENYSLLYKTYISKEKRIFCKKETFESASYLVAERTWKSHFLFKCPACKQFFKERESLRDHGIRWCLLQHSMSEPSSLFPPLSQPKGPSPSSKENENFCNEDNCLKCTKIFDLIQNHKQEVLTENKKAIEAPQENGVDEEMAQDASPGMKLTRARRPLTEEGFFHEASGGEDEEEVEDEKAPPRKRGRKPKARLLVETLGLNTPPSKTILHFNRLPKQAMSLGSTVLPKRMRTSLHNCSLCDFKSNDRLSFLAHIKEHADKYEDSYLQCKECGMSFASEPSWKKHLFLIHRIRHPAPSDYLSDLTHLDEDSGDMRLVIDEERRPNVCQVCNRSFECLKDLKKHSRGHGSPATAQMRKRSIIVPTSGSGAVNNSAPPI